jgi:hypothetical protein
VRCHIFWKVFSIMKSSSFKADFVFGNSQKSFGAKSGEEGGCSSSVTDFGATNCLTESALLAGTLSWQRIQSLGQSSGLS